MKSYYLIDYENVGSNGFLGCENLNKQTEIHIFYTNNSKKIDLDIFYNHGQANIIVHKVPSGKQSLDLHISSFIGYLVGLNSKKEFNCIIISKDTDYDNIISFWEREKNIKILRYESIDPTAETFQLLLDNDLTTNIQKALEDIQTINEDIEYITNVCNLYINSKNKKQDIYRNIIYKYGQEKGLTIYTKIKNLL